MLMGLQEATGYLSCLTDESGNIFCADGQCDVIVSGVPMNLDEVNVIGMRTDLSAGFKCRIGRCPSKMDHRPLPFRSDGRTILASLHRYVFACFSKIVQEWQD